MPFERVLAHHRLAALGQVGERNLLVAAAVEDELLHALGQLARTAARDRSPTCFARLPQQLEVELVAPVPALDRAGRERQLRERDDALRIEEADRAQAVAARARAHRAVEREEPRLELGERVVADRARELGREEVLRGSSFSLSISTTIARPSPWRSAVSNDSASRCLNSARTLSRSTTTSIVCFVFLASLRHRVDLVHLAVDAHAHEPLRAELDEELELLALAVDDDRREDHELRVLAESASVASTICEIVIAASFCSG